MLYDQLTIDRIQTMHPCVREELKEQYLDINSQLPKGVRLRFTHTFRTNEQQDKLFNQRPKVTNARGGQSIHNYGLAFDIVILLDKDKNGTFETVSWEIDEHWKKVANYFKAKGWEWGGDWIFKDYPHFEISGVNWRDLIKRKKFKQNNLEYPVL